MCVCIIANVIKHVTCCIIMMYTVVSLSILCLTNAASHTHMKILLKSAVQEGFLTPTGLFLGGWALRSQSRMLSPLVYLLYSNNLKHASFLELLAKDKSMYTRFARELHRWSWHVSLSRFQMDNFSAAWVQMLCSTRARYCQWILGCLWSYCAEAQKKTYSQQRLLD